MVTTEAVTLATNTVFLGCAAILICAAFFIWLAPKPKPRVAPGGPAPAQVKEAAEIEQDVVVAH